MARARAVETPRAREHSLGRRAAVAGALKVAWRKVGRITRQAHEGTIAVTNGAVAISGPALLGQNALTARLGTVRAAQADVVDDATTVAGIHVRASRDVEGIRRKILLPGLASAADRVRHEQQREEKASKGECHRDCRRARNGIVRVLRSRRMLPRQRIRVCHADVTPALAVAVSEPV